MFDKKKLAREHDNICAKVLTMLLGEAPAQVMKVNY